jgi:hypothetical protein
MFWVVSNIGKSSYRDRIYDLLTFRSLPSGTEAGPDRASTLLVKLMPPNIEAPDPRFRRPVQRPRRGSGRSPTSIPLVSAQRADIRGYGGFTYQLPCAVVFSAPPTSRITDLLHSPFVAYDTDRYWQTYKGQCLFVCSLNM